MKHGDVLAQLNQDGAVTADTSMYVVVADTIVIATDAHGSRKVLGQPDPDHWQNDVRTWFRERLSGELMMS